MTMKTILMLLVLIASAIAQAPKSYTVARTDQIVTQPPAVLPNWGGAVGAGKKWCNPAFNNLCIIRLTDSTTRPDHGSLTTADTGDAHLTTTDSRHVIAHTNGGSLIVGFDPATEKPSPTPLTFNYTVQASESDSQVLYALHGTQIQRLTANAGWTGIASHAVLFDFASTGCLGAGFIPTWHGVFTIAGNPPVFKTAFSRTGAQGSGRYIVAWSAANGCSVYDTVAGTVTKNGVALGLVTVPARFYLHAGGAGRNPAYATTDPTVHQPNGASGCLIAAGCGAYYFWQIGTTNVFMCGLPFNKPPYCDGHLGQLPSGALSGFQYTEHFWNNPVLPLISFGSIPFGSGDSHQSADNGADINGPPLFVFTQVIPAPATFLKWGTNEILALQLDGSRKWSRFGQNLNTGKSPLFVCANSIGAAFQQGNFALFTSDMGGKGALGFEADGKTSRCDVFAIETK